MKFLKPAFLAASLAAMALSGCATTSESDGIGFTVLPMEDFDGLGATLKTKVPFAQNERELTTTARQRVDDQVPLLRSNRRTRVVVAGHASAEGDADYNRDLSVQRGRVVAQRLVDRGVERNRIVIIGFGENRPDTSVDGGRSNTANRRAEIYVY